MGQSILPLMTGIETNPELDLAFEYLSQTRRHIFLTGKAGTGKTTFLHRVRKEVPKRKVVVAPTGVAAINAKGTTIHSLFQLPFGVLTPQRLKDEMPKRRFSGQKIDLFRSLDLLIIDEISMVRADVLDAIDDVLRRYRRSNEPFGGLQLLMIGDLHQLPPVVRPNDWMEMSPHYPTAYFFGSAALRKAAPTTIQLKRIYRQADDVFIDLLNKVRNNRIDQQVLEQLNQRFIKDFMPENVEDNFITLTSHNATANKINKERLAELTTIEHSFSAEIENDFPASMYPNEPHLTFKIGCQVMFNKNDGYPDRQYYNGKIGRIVGIDGDTIQVSCPDEPDIFIDPVIWENRKFQLNPNTKEIEERVVGTYTQHPLRLAWAITIHKSQGLTFDRVIIDAAAAFAHGQVYVALSRCKSFEGIVLRSELLESSVRTDRVVSDYSNKAEANPPTEEDLRLDKHEFQSDILRQLFNFSLVESSALFLQRALLENEKSIQGNGISDYNKIMQVLDQEVVTMGNRFMPSLQVYLQDQRLPTENGDLQERLDGAAPYFSNTIRQKLLPALAKFGIMTDNQGVGEQVEERLRYLTLQLFVKDKLFQTLEDGFDPIAYLKTKADAQTDFEKNSKKASADFSKRKAIPKDLKNKPLYLELLRWRELTTKALGITASNVAPNAALLSITEILPTTKKSLLAVPKFGRKRYEDYGEAILTIVKNYLSENDQPSDLFISGGNSKKSGKLDTRYQSLLLHQGGYSIEEIANARSLKENTIFTHLTYWVEEKEIAPAVLVDQPTLDILLPYIQEHPTMDSGALYRAFNGQYDYPILRVALAASKL